MSRVITAIEISGLLAAAAAVLYVLFAFARHAHDRILVMLSTGYYWRDAGVILRRQNKERAGPIPGRHRLPAGKPPEPAGKVLQLPPGDVGPAGPWPPDNTAPRQWAQPPNPTWPIPGFDDDEASLPEGWEPAREPDHTWPSMVPVADLPPGTQPLELAHEW